MRMSRLFSSKSFARRWPAASLVRCTVDSDKRSDAIFGSNLSAASSKLSPVVPINVTNSSAAGVNRFAVKPARWSQGAIPPHRWQ